MLREELRKLPKAAVESLGRRARAVIPQLFPGEIIKEAISDPADRLAARFLVWAASADDQKFVEALQALSADGRRPVPGRKRRGGKRSRARIEPAIMGVARGAGTRTLWDGAPTEGARPELVMHLAMAWLAVTEQAPEAGRSDGPGFGDLVHSVFQWLDLSEDPYEAATYALRRYWDTLKSQKARAAPVVMPLVCTECRWVGQGATPDEFFCEKLSRACATARDTAGDCGPEGLLFEQG